MLKYCIGTRLLFQNEEVQSNIELMVGVFCSFLTIFKTCIISEFKKELMVLKSQRQFSGEKNAGAGTVTEST